MALHSWTVRRLSVLTETSVGHTGVLDLLDSVEVHGSLAIAALSGTGAKLAVQGEHSIDGRSWQALGGLGFGEKTAVDTYLLTATESAYRYLRFSFVLSGTTPSAVFGLDLFVKTRATWPPGILQGVVFQIERICPFATLPAPA